MISLAVQTEINVEHSLIPAVFVMIWAGTPNATTIIQLTGNELSIYKV